MPSFRLKGLVVAAVLALAGCSGSSDLDDDGESSPAGGPSTETRYSMANGCFALQSKSSLGFVRTASGSYVADAGAASGGEPLFLKPSALGRYLLYTRDGGYLAVVGSGVGRAANAGAAADWTVNRLAAGTFTLDSASAGKALAVGAGGTLILADATVPAAQKAFDFAKTTGCTAFPEAQLNATGTTFKGRGVDQPALGFADVHNHVSATDFLGGAHYGRPFSPYGITDALGNCAAVHGPDGALDLVGNFLGGNPVGQHDTIGWPTFVDWPAARSLMHEGLYYKWIERAWLAGLRILVSNTVENETLCSLEKLQQLDPAHDCNEMVRAKAQVPFMLAMQDYIDAQSGGPGKGWFRIVRSPSEARQVINDGKLAVVLGIEVSHLFDCKVTYDLLGNPVPGCDEATIDRQVDEIVALGIRQAFLIHEFDNAFGGNGLFNGFVLNIGNRLDTGRFWQTYDCPDPATTEYFDEPGATMTGLPTALPGLDPISQAINDSGVLSGVLPIYDTANKQCNARGFTDLGRYAVQKMMEKKIIIETDHIDPAIKEEMIAMAEAQTPGYPLVSTHQAHGGTTMDQARRMMALGGLIYPYKGNGEGWNADLQRILPLKNPSFAFGVGFGADTNGLGDQAGPRAAGRTAIQYPFTLFEGEGWGP
ncbi:MAG TPA: hypothetical protein VJM11_00665, partial [Nevskiaceae bacterium]|nr:hypothetical protein [Nevskiaceae bacterium]